MSLIKLNNNFYYEIRPILKEKISVRGAPDFMEFFNSLDKQGDRYKEINEALDLLNIGWNFSPKVDLFFLYLLAFSCAVLKIVVGFSLERLFL